MYNKIMILGNGFDLDFGLKTRYCDFMNSKVWKEAKNKDFVSSYGIVNYLEEKSKLSVLQDLV